MFIQNSSGQVSRCYGCLISVSCRISNAVKTSGVLKERLFNAAYNSKRQAVISGMLY